MKSKEAPYLTEDGLESYLSIIFPGQNIIKQFRFDNSRFCFDYNITDSKILVEFDGDSHYVNPDVIRRDLAKDELSKANGYELIRIPYWVQIDAESVAHYFNRSKDIKTAYPHGFISKKVILPSFYCEMGTERFIKELSELPLNIQKSVITSLYDKQKLHGKKFTANRDVWSFVTSGPQSTLKT